MKKILLLTKVFLKNSFTFNYNRNKDTETKVNTKKKVRNSIGILLIIAYLALIFGFMSYQLINMLMQFNQEALFLGGFLLAIAGLLIFQTIFSGINIFYFSKDVEYILPLPLKPFQIIAAKFNTLLITEYCTEMIFAIAPLIVYGVLTSASLMFYVYGFLVLLIFPILPAIVTTLLVMLIMSFAKFTKNRDVFQVITAIIAIVLAVGMQLIINDTIEYTQEEMIEMITKANGMVTSVTKYFPTIDPSLDAMLESDTVNGALGLLKLAGITVAGYIIFILIGNKVYLRGAIGNTENSSSKKKFVSGTGKYKRRKVSLAYFLKEMKILFRNPIYFIQCVLPIVLIPVVFLVIFLKGGTSGDEELQAIGNMLKSAEVESLNFLLIIIGIIHFMFMFAFTTITAISRDGKTAIFVKQIPISLYKQFVYKMIPGLVFNIVQICIVLGVIIYMFPTVSIVFLLAVFIVSLLLAILQNYLYLMVDLKRPKLEWDSEYAVVKQNMNMIYQFATIAVIIGVLVLIGFLLKDITVNVYVVFAGMVFISALGIFMMDKYIRKNEEKVFEKIV